MAELLTELMPDGEIITADAFRAVHQKVVAEEGEKKGERKIKCKVCTLSEVIESKNINNINLLKMDCEGHEWEVIKGINDNHWPIIQSIVMEVHDIDQRVLKVENVPEYAI